MTSPYQQSTKPDENFIVTRFFSRPLAYPLALLFKKLGVSPNAVTILGGLAWLASVPCIVRAGPLFQQDRMADGWTMMVIVTALWILGFILDVADGSLARMTHAATLSGFYLDYYFHLLFQPMFLCSIGVLLFLVTGSSGYLILGILAISCNWGVSFCAKEHVLCEQVAKGRAPLATMSHDDRYRLFIDSPGTKAAVSNKTGPITVVRHLIEELLSFPGNYAFLGLSIMSDLALCRGGASSLPILRHVFIGASLIMLARVPFRAAREFRIMRDYELGINPAGTPERNEDPTTTP